MSAFPIASFMLRSIAIDPNKCFWPFVHKAWEEKTEIQKNDKELEYWYVTPMRDYVKIDLCLIMKSPYIPIALLFQITSVLTKGGILLSDPEDIFEFIKQ